MTFMDEMKKFILKFTENSDDWLVEKLMIFLDEELYDTESVRADVETIIAKVFDGNINVDSFGQEIPSMIATFIKNVQGIYIYVSVFWTHLNL